MEDAKGGRGEEIGRNVWLRVDNNEEGVKGKGRDN